MKIHTENFTNTNTNSNNTQKRLHKMEVLSKVWSVCWGPGFNPGHLTEQQGVTQHPTSELPDVAPLLPSGVCSRNPRLFQHPKMSNQFIIAQPSRAGRNEQNPLTGTYEDPQLTRRAVWRPPFTPQKMRRQTGALLPDTLLLRGQTWGAGGTAHA